MGYMGYIVAKVATIMDFQNKLEFLKKHGNVTQCDRMLFGPFPVLLISPKNYKPGNFSRTPTD